MSEPSGASVKRDGEDAGTTPLEVEIPRGSEPFALELTHPRHRKAVIRIVPDRDKEVHVELSVVRSTKTVIIEQPAAPGPRRDNKKMDQLLD